MPERLEIRLLGPFEVLVGGRPADVGGAKRQALLAMLALRPGRVVGVDTLVDALWGEELPAAPRNALQHHVARLRAALGQERDRRLRGRLRAERGERGRDPASRSCWRRRAPRCATATLSGADAVDAALALWRGPALQGLAATTWFGHEARRLETLRVDALEEQFEAALALGEHRELIPQLRSALADNPYRERLWGQLMLALYRSGRQADALETFQEARRCSPTSSGSSRGRSCAGSRMRSSATTRRSRPSRPVAGAAATCRPVDVLRRTRGGAEREVRELLHEHRLVTVTGAPGVGKSRLAVESARSLEDVFPDGIWLVDFARAGDAGDALRLLANAVDARGSTALARVCLRLQARHGAGRARRVRARPRGGGPDRVDAAGRVPGRPRPRDEP